MTTQELDRELGNVDDSADGWEDEYAAVWDIIAREGRIVGARVA
jgi:hypothetical protein